MAVASSTQQAFAAALEELVGQIRKDRSILAAVLCGSLSHDTVWARSDIDLVLVTVDDRLVPPGGVALNAGGVNVHALLMPRTRFRQVIEGSIASSFTHSFLAKGRLLYTHDPTIEELFAHLQERGDRDVQVQLLEAGASVLSCLYKARKWFVTRGDLHYSALWLLYAATALAHVEVVSRGLLADREVLPQALALNPGFFSIVYTDLLNTPKTRAAVAAALDAADAYVAERTTRLFGLVEAYLREAGEARSAGEIESHFTRQFDVHGVTTVCEYLADAGRLSKVSLPTRLTKKSNVAVQELAFVHLTG